MMEWLIPKRHPVIDERVNEIELALDRLADRRRDLVREIVELVETKPMIPAE